MESAVQAGGGFEQLPGLGGRALGVRVVRTPTRGLAHVATCAYIRIMPTGIRELKDNLSRYIRRIEAGERISVTAHGRVVAELVPPGSGPRIAQRSRFDKLVATGVIRPPVEAGDPLEDWPDIRLARGTAADLIDSDRGEA